MGKSEDLMKILDRQQFGFSSIQPFFLGYRLTLRAMPIPARVIHRALMVAGVASLHMTTKRGGSALLDMAHDPPLMGGQMPLRLIARAIETDDVCHLPPWTVGRRSHFNQML